MFKDLNGKQENERSVCAVTTAKVNALFARKSGDLGNRDRPGREVSDERQ